MKNIFKIQSKFKFMFLWFPFLIIFFPMPALDECILGL